MGQDFARAFLEMGYERHLILTRDGQVYHEQILETVPGRGVSRATVNIDMNTGTIEADGLPGCALPENAENKETFLAMLGQNLRRFVSYRANYTTCWLWLAFFLVVSFGIGWVIDNRAGWATPHGSNTLGHRGLIGGATHCSGLFQAIRAF